MSQWQTKDQVTISPALSSSWDVEAQADRPLQTIDGFGARFNEFAWTSLSAIEMRTKRLCSENCSPPAFGANFNTCRMPVGANDFSLDWYSYDETPGDFALKHFSISKDLETLVPFIKTKSQAGR